MPASFAFPSRSASAGLRRVAACVAALALGALAALAAPPAIAAMQEPSVPHPPGVPPPVWMNHAFAARRHSRMHAPAAPRRGAPPPVHSWRRAGPALTTAPAGRFGPEQAVALRGIVDLTWSRDGRRLAFVVQDPDTAASTTNLDLYLGDVDRLTVRRLTRNPSPDVSPTFSPGGDTLAYVSTRGSGEAARPTIVMLSLRGGEPWEFGHYDEAIGEVQWSPDGRSLAYVKVDTLSPRVRELRKRKWDVAIEDDRPQYPHLWVVDLASGRQRELITGPHYVWRVRWSPDSRWLAFLVSPTGAAEDEQLTDIGVVPAVGGSMRALGAVGPAPFVWSPDSRWIAWASPGDRRAFVAKSDKWVASPLGGHATNLTADFDFDPGTPAWSPHSDTLFFHYEHGVATALAAVPRAGGRVRIVTDRAGAAGDLVMSANGHAAWVESHPEMAPEVVCTGRPERDPVTLTQLNASVDRTALGDTRVVRWHSTDGVVVEGLLLRPPGAPARGALKTLVLLHSGPYGAVNDLGFQAWAQVFAGGGYQVFMPNYRSSGGYGTAFMLRKRADWGGQDWRDVTGGLDSLVHAGLVDPQRLGVLGGSYGGYLTAWGITRTTRFKAAYMDRGIVDLPALWGESDVRQYRAWEFGGRPWETFDRWREASPIAHIAGVKTPTLIVVGENDRRTPVTQSLELYHALQSLGVPTVLARYPREGHGLREPHHREDAMDRARAWFDRWIR